MQVLLSTNCTEFGLWFVHLIFYVDVLNFWFPMFTTYWTFFAKWFMWVLIVTRKTLKKEQLSGGKSKKLARPLSLPVYYVIGFHFSFTVRAGPGWTFVRGPFGDRCSRTITVVHILQSFDYLERCLKFDIKIGLTRNSSVFKNILMSSETIVYDANVVNTTLSP